ncbi:MAG: reprolysin-like metallopeptidase [Pseudomonadota bacterium]
MRSKRSSNWSGYVFATLIWALIVGGTVSAAVIEERALALHPEFFKQFSQARKTIWLPAPNAPDGEFNLITRRRYVSGDAVHWSGHRRVKPVVEASLVIGANNAIVGALHVEGHHYRIRGNPDDGYVIAAIDPVRRLEPTLDDAESVVDTAPTRAKSSTSITRGAFRHPRYTRKFTITKAVDIRDVFRPIDMSPDDGSRIDALFVYTASAADYFFDIHGVNWRYEFALQSLQVDQILSGSGVSATLNLVHNEEVNYRASDPELYDELYDLRDGMIAGVHALRDAHRADLVILFVRNNLPTSGSQINNCGRAFHLDVIAHPGSDPTPDDGRGLYEGRGFAVVDAKCAYHGFTLAHEIGHTLGAHHDAYALSLTGSSPTPSFARGMNLPGPDFRTVMAYRDFCLDVVGRPCALIPRFSNPLTPYNGFPTGISSGGILDPMDNALAMNNRRWTVANYRNSKFGPFP